MSEDLWNGGCAELQDRLERFRTSTSFEIDEPYSNERDQMNRRIAGYDLARCLALFGLVVANFSRGVETTDFGLYHLIQARLHGGAVATFLVLGGVGISLLTQRAQITDEAHRITDNRKRLIKRAASLLVVGICCNLIWYTNFLCHYSICIAIGALLLTVSNRWLWSLTFVFVAIFVVFIFLIFNYFEILRNWETLRGSNPWTVEGIFVRLYVNGFHAIFSRTAFVLIGMWLGRQEVHYLRVRRDMFLGGIVVALVVGGILWPLLRYLDLSESGIRSFWRLLAALYFFVMCGGVIAIIGGSLMLTEKYPAAKWTKPFIATGQLALTLYVIHLVIGMGLLKAKWLLEALRVLDIMLPYALGSAAIFCICAVIFSHFWRKRFERGPIEWGIRRITG